jgi:hypothetical protein
MTSKNGCTMTRHAPAARTRWRTLAAVAALATASTAVPAALVLQTPTSFTDIALSGPGCATSSCTGQNSGTTFASIQIGATFAEADALAGLIRGNAEATGDSSGQPLGAGTGAFIEVKLLNTGAAPVSLPAGALVFNVDTLLSRTGSPFFSSSTVASSLAYGSDPGNTASASFTYSYAQTGSTPGVVQFVPSFMGNATLSVNSTTDSLLDVSFASGPIVIQPGDTLRASFLFQPAVLTLGAGATTRIDTTNTGLFKLTLPAGTVFDSGGLPVTWVSVVPEPAPLVLWALGAAAVLAAVRRRPRAA